jgi:hypothetical protein
LTGRVKVLATATTLTWVTSASICFADAPSFHVDFHGRGEADRLLADVAGAQTAMMLSPSADSSLLTIQPR